jgi:hypothetical protein
MEDLLQQEDQLTNLDLEIDYEAKQSLTNAAYWAKFISIFIFSCSALIILLLVVASSAFTNGFKRGFGQALGIFEAFNGGALLAVFFVVLLLIAVVYYFLYNFGVKVKAAMLTDNVEQLNSGLSSLKIYFIIMGVFGILGIVTSLYAFVNIFNLM